MESVRCNVHGKVNSASTNDQARPIGRYIVPAGGRPPTAALSHHVTKISQDHTRSSLSHIITRVLLGMINISFVRRR